MAVLNGIQNLEESPLSESIVANKFTLLGDVGEQVTFWAVLNNNVSAVRSIHDLYQRHHIGMGARLVMQLNLTLLELALTGLKA